MSYSIENLFETGSNSPQGVIHVHRRNRAHAGNQATSTPVDQIIAHFSDNVERPLELDFGFYKRKVRDFTVAVVRYCKTQKFGHTLKNCNTKYPKLPIFSGQHQWKECSQNAEEKFEDWWQLSLRSSFCSQIGKKAIRKVCLFVIGTLKNVARLDTGTKRRWQIHRKRHTQNKTTSKCRLGKDIFHCALAATKSVPPVLVSALLGNCKNSSKSSNTMDVQR